MRTTAWLRGSVLLAVAFASGIAVGVTYERSRSRLSAPMTAAGHDAMQHLAQTLDLDSQQEQAIAAILNRRQSEVDAAWHAMQPHIRATLDSTSTEIIAVLRPDQAARFRQMIQTAHSPQHHR